MPDYAIEKFLPLLSRWHLLHDDTGNQLNLEYIVKKRNIRSVLSYEVKWKDFDRNTIEPMSYLKRKYQSAIDDFEAAKQNKTKKGKFKLMKIRLNIASFLKKDSLVVIGNNLKMFVCTSVRTSLKYTCSNYQTILLRMSDQQKFEHDQTFFFKLQNNIS